MTTARGAGRPPDHGGLRDGLPGVPGPGSHGPGSHGPSSHGPAGPHGPQGPFSYSKALAIVAVAVILGVYLLSLGNGHPAPAPSATTTTSTTSPSSSTSTTGAPTSTTLAQATPSKSVLVLVANASHTTGIAGYYTTQLSKDGWGTLTPVTALTVETSSTVYFATGQQAAAQTVATDLHLPSSAVKALGASIPVSSTTGADVVVVAGTDLAGKVPTTTTTTAAG